MEHPVRVAFCKVLFWKNGGTFTATGLPDLGDQEQLVRGKCNGAYDCGSCTYLQAWIEFLQSQGWEFGWECDKCLRETEDLEKRSNIHRFVQGFFQAGRKRNRTSDDLDYDPDQPDIEGCTKCGWETSFLQLVLRKPK